MTDRKFIKALANDKEDAVGKLLRVIEEAKAAYAIIGGLALNAYTEPVVSLDIDVVVETARLDAFLESARKHGFSVKRYAHGINLKVRGSDFRIQLRTDPRYNAFTKGARMRTVLGYRIKVASAENVLQGKIWAYMDEKRRPSKRQKDLADIMRLIEKKTALKKLVPAEILSKLD